LGIGPNPQSPIPNPQSPIPKFIYNDNYYFFYKLFSLSKENKLLLFKLNKDEKDEKDYATSGKTFIEDKTLDLDHELIWFSQKNNNELSFFLK